MFTPCKGRDVDLQQVEELIEARGVSFPARSRGSTGAGVADDGPSAVAVVSG